MPSAENKYSIILNRIDTIHSNVKIKSANFTKEVYDYEYARYIINKINNNYVGDVITCKLAGYDITTAMKQLNELLAYFENY